jgi:GTPase SAR1 family protein
MLQKNRRGVYCLGLYGMGGLGKTTMCKELCSYFGPRLFHRVCHVEIGSNDTDPEEKKFKRHIKILESFSDMPTKQISNLDYHKVSCSWKRPGVDEWDRGSIKFDQHFWCVTAFLMLTSAFCVRLKSVYNTV